MSKTIAIDHVDKFYGDFQAIKDVSLHIKEGEFFTLLGPPAAERPRFCG